VTHALTCAQLIQYSAVYRLRSLSPKCLRLPKCLMKNDDTSALGNTGTSHGNKSFSLQTILAMITTKSPAESDEAKVNFSLTAAIKLNK